VLAAKARCTRPVVLPEPPLLVAQAVDCHGSGWTVKSKYPDDFPDDSVSFMTFNNNEGRDAWLQVAATLGDHGVIKGDRFVVEIPDQLPDLEPLALRLAEWLSGERVL
jgi:hypothetical protein